MNNDIERFRPAQERGLNTLFNRSGAAAQRQQAQQFANVRHDVQVTACRLDGAAALAGYTMERAVQLDAQRRALADGDPLLDAILTDIEVTFLQQAKAIGRRAFDSWGF